MFSEDKCTSYYARMKYLQETSVSDVLSFRSRDGKTILDMFIEDAAWNRVESDHNQKAFWTHYVMVVGELYKMNVPMTLALDREVHSIWQEGALGGLYSPMCWDGIIGLAVEVGPNDFKPFQWGAHDFISEHLSQEVVDKLQGGRCHRALDALIARFADLAANFGSPAETTARPVNPADLRAFFVDMVVCVMDWELHAPELQMLDKYRRLGGTTRVAGGSVLLELLAHVAEDSHAYHDEDDADQTSRSMSKANVVMEWTRILKRWQAAEESWSAFLVRTLVQALPGSCADIVDSFLLGLKSDQPSMPRLEEKCEKESPPGVSEFIESQTSESPPDVTECMDHEEAAAIIDLTEAFHVSESPSGVTEYIEHEEAAAVIDPTEASHISNQRWAGFVQDRDRIIAEMMRNGLPDYGSAESGSMTWIESSSEMPPFELEWTGQMRPRASQLGDTVYLIGFTHAGRNLQAAISGVELETVRNNIRKAGFEFKLRCGAHILLYPDQYIGIGSVLKLTGLRPHHILINEAFLPLLLNEIRKLPSRSNVRCSSVHPAVLVGDDHDVAVVEKTFFNFEPRLLRGIASVTQSATDARHGVNPRRFRAGLGSIMCCARRVQPSEK